MQSERVEEALKDVHAHQHAERDLCKYHIADEDLQVKDKLTKMKFTLPRSNRNLPSVISKKTFESCAWANDSAHRRRYDAVFDIVPKTYSIVSMT